MASGGAKGADRVLGDLIEAARMAEFEVDMPHFIAPAIRAGIGEIRRLLDIIDRAAEALAGVEIGPLPGASRGAIVDARAILAEADPADPEVGGGEGVGDG